MNKMLITTAGLAEIVNAEQSGTAPVVLSHVAFGTGQYTATADMTKLKSEFKRFDSVAGGAIADNMIHLTIHDNSTDKYTVNEVGVFTASGTLFAVISQTTPIMEKSATSESMLAIDIALTDIDASSITFGDTNLVLNPATTDAAGIVELATDAEAKTGTDTTRAVTPAALDATIESHDNIVHKSGAEAIPGYKCFTGDVGKRNNNADVSTVPENNTYSSFDFSDKNNKKYASVVGSTYTDGDVGAILATNRTINGVEYHSQIHVRLDKNGKGYATAPTPAAGDNSTKIATTAWVNTKAANFLPLAGGTMSGNITFNANDGVAFASGGIIRKSGADNADLTIMVKNSDWNQTYIYLRDSIFGLGAGNGTNIKWLTGNVDGSLTWNGKNIVRSVNGTAADAAGNVAITSVQNATNATTATKATQDGTGKVIADTYLPKSGGAMTADKAIYRNVNTGHLALYGGTGNNNDGAQLDLCGSSHSTMPGTFQLHARTPDKDVILRGMTDGKLTWGDKYVLTNSYVATVDNGAVMLTAGTSNTTGATFRLYGGDHSTGAGQFTIGAAKSKIFYAWAISSGNSMYSVFYTTSPTPAIGDDVLRYEGQTEIMVAYGFVDSCDGETLVTRSITCVRDPSQDTVLGSAANLTGKPDGTLTWDGVNMSAMSMPSGTYKDLTLGVSGSTYTAPADGWFVLGKNSGVTGAWISLNNSTAKICSNQAAPGASNGMYNYVPAKKGDSITVTYSATGTTINFYFIYAEGAKHLAS